MAIVVYPAFRQCVGSDREEVTQILSDVSDSGVIRGRAMYSSQSYNLTLVHEALTRDDYEAWEAFWDANYFNQFDITWKVDDLVYRGIPNGAPSLAYLDGDRFTVTIVFIVKKLAA
jgi:hypothetical protein